MKNYCLAILLALTSVPFNTHSHNTTPTLTQLMRSLEREHVKNITSTRVEKITRSTDYDYRMTLVMKLDQLLLSKSGLSIDTCAESILKDAHTNTHDLLAQHAHAPFPADLRMRMTQMLQETLLTDKEIKLLYGTQQDMDPAPLILYGCGPEKPVLLVNGSVFPTLSLTAQKGALAHSVGQLPTAALDTIITTVAKAALYTEPSAVTSIHTDLACAADAVAIFQSKNPLTTANNLHALLLHMLDTGADWKEIHPRIQALQSLKKDLEQSPMIKTNRALTTAAAAAQRTFSTAALFAKECIARLPK